MDHIIQALERAKEGQESAPPPLRTRESPTQSPTFRPASASVTRSVEVSTSHLDQMRIVAHDAAKPQSRAFDFLRTQVTQAMLSKDWLILGITSPTPGCGKTFTAMNLALSMARQPDSAVLLIDLDLAKPQIAHRFGLTPSTGVRAALKEPRLVNEAVTRISIGELDLGILPCERPSSRPSDLISSTQMAEVVQRLRSDKKFKIIIFDLPPVLTGDDVIAALPFIDCVLLVAAAGTTKDAEIKECGQYLSSTPVVRVVLNKIDSAPLTYY